MSRIDGEGRVTNGPLTPIDTSLGKPSELCWLQVTSDNSLVLATNFGYGTVSTYRLVAGRLSLLQDPANNAIPGDGTFRAVNGLVSSGPSDSWLTPDDQYFYQIFGNASVLVSYRLDKTSGRLTEIGRNPNSLQQPPGSCGVISVYRRSAIDQARSSFPTVIRSGGRASVSIAALPRKSVNRGDTMAQLDAYDQRSASPILFDTPERNEEFLATRVSTELTRNDHARRSRHGVLAFKC